MTPPQAAQQPNQAHEFRGGWLFRLKCRLFPSHLRPEIEGDERTYLTTNIHVTVDWRDRLRLLVSGRALVQVRTYTDVLVNEAQSVSVFEVEAP